MKVPRSCTTCGGMESIYEARGGRLSRQGSPVLDEAKQIAGKLSLHHIVAREAYFAAYHAAAGAADASSAIGTASRFIDCIAELLSESPL